MGGVLDFVPLDVSNSRLQSARMSANLLLTSLLFASAAGRGAALSGAAPAFFRGRMRA